MKQFQISIDGKIANVINLNSNEVVSIHIANNPMAKNSRFPITSIRAEGSRWSEDDYYTLEWQEVQLETGSMIQINYIEGNLDATPLIKEEKFIAPEEECSFCQKKKSQVKLLIQAHRFAHICNECVATCMDLVKENAGVV